MNRINATAALVASAAAACGQSPVLTRNPGFLDTDTSGMTGDEWLSFGAAAVDVNFFGDGNTGHATLFGDNTANVGGVFQLGIPATPGTEYELTLRIQWEVNWDAATYVALEFFAADDATLIDAVEVEIVDELVDAGYQRFDLSAVAPAGAAFVRPLIRYDSVLSNGSQRACTVDNILLREKDNVLGLNPGLGDVVGDGNNGDFWGTFGAVALDLDFNNNGNPGHATFFSDMPGNDGGLFQLGIPAIPNESYTLTVDMDFEENWDANTFIALEFYGADDSFIVDFEEIEITETPGAGFITYTLEAVAPDFFTSFVRPLIRFENSTGGDTGRAATIDNVLVQLTSEVGPTPCSDADFAAPLGTLDIADVVAFLQAFGAGDTAADLAAPSGTFDIADVVGFLQIFGAGCP